MGFGWSAYQRRSCATSAAPGPRRASTPPVPLWGRKLVEEVFELSFGVGRRPDRRGSPPPPCAARSRPRRERVVGGRPAQVDGGGAARARRPAIDSSHGERPGPSSDDDPRPGARALAASAGYRRPRCRPSRIARLRVVAHPGCAGDRASMWRSRRTGRCRAAHRSWLVVLRRNRSGRRASRVSGRSSSASVG